MVFQRASSRALIRTHEGREAVREAVAFIEALPVSGEALEAEVVSSYKPDVPEKPKPGLDDATALSFGKSVAASAANSFAKAEAR
jgi:hypothetical protein